MSSSLTTMPDQDEDPEFTALLSTLPKQTIIREGGSAYVYEYQGFWYASYLLRGLVSVQQQFQALPTDIFICGAVKTGNTWLKSLCFAIATRKQYPPHHHDDDGNNNNNPLLSNVSHSLVPVLELEYPKYTITRNNNYNHNLLSTHAPYAFLPKSITSSGCKIIYICREPKDMFVSLFHFFQNLRIPTTSFKKQNLDLTREVDLFCEGKNDVGLYWDHVLGYHKASLERPEKFLFLKYEQLKTDAVLYVKKLAAFMDQPFSDDEELEGVPEKIVEMCSFGNLSGLENNKTGKYCRGGIQIDNYAFFRKGNTGDWRNELSEEMAEKIDRITEEKLKGSGFSFA